MIIREKFDSEDIDSIILDLMDNRLDLGIYRLEISPMKKSMSKFNYDLVYRKGAYIEKVNEQEIEIIWNKPDSEARFKIKRNDITKAYFDSIANRYVFLLTNNHKIVIDY